MLRLFFKYFRFLKSYTPYLVLIFIGDFLVANFGLITPLFSRILFDYAYPLRDLFLLNVVIIASVGIYFLEFFINVMSDYMGTYVDQEFTFDLTKKLFHKCQRLPLDFHSQKTAGDLVNRFTGDTDTVVGSSIDTIPEIIINVYTLISILIIAMLMNYHITLLALLSIPFYIIETKFFASKEEKLEEEEIDLDNDYFDTLTERFKSIKTIKAFGQEKRETQRVLRQRRMMNVVAIKQGLISIISVFANSVTIRMWTIFVSWYMGYLVIQGELTIGEIVAMLAYVVMLSEPIEALSGIYGDLKVSMVSYRRIDEILTTKAEDESEGRAKKIKIDKGIISFDKVDFSYTPDEENILEELSFQLKGRTAVAIVGESGSGKSTLISLLMRFYGTKAGGIYIDGQKISEVNLRSLRDQIGLVEQDYTLFAGTVRENLMYGNKGKTEAAMIKACKQAQIYDFIQEQDDGFDMEVGSQGEGLSGGQKQRIAIARVLLKDPEIIIFDEATSALDPESEYKITEVINDLIGKKNLFIIAHRLSTIKKVNLIMMLEDGQIAEQGTFHELLDKKGAFFRYYSLQFGGFEVFKKILEIEYERVSRYGSIFNLTAVEALSYDKIAKDYGEDWAMDYMRELNLHFKRFLRKGDNAAVFYKNIILIMLPEITEEKVFGFCKRMDVLFKKDKIQIGEKKFPVKLRYSAVHVAEVQFKVVDDLIKQAIAGFHELKGTKKNYIIHGVLKKKKVKKS